MAEILPSISREMDPHKEKTEEFPEKETADGGRFGDYDVYDKEEVDDWFKRCKAGFPEGEQITHSPMQSLVFYQWFEKWFSQFKKEEAS